ncbi:Na+/H+ antiporter NhaA [Ornithinicoccus hortensis]|uniref:Na(+)/H(+) antiporter NhaA n=1 Tax=Ornithinicoccus hortensis TaxID=82346 RepID=A0A542YT74_9MICO|nr:Na+/H+ antiporter NhaA [Ornithinicoccus hortensis]TQL51278.1 NhaA family Na+:H+ antiporter [Ornithinicoccus hortensis]
MTGSDGTATHPDLRSRLVRLVAQETTAGALLFTAAVLALVWANSPWRDAYQSLSSTVVGPSALHLDLSLATWAADGVLALFFFVVGLELKQEFVSGSLSNLTEAAVPVLAAVGGMAVPAVLYVVLVTAQGDSAALGGWAIPTATDIAFAVAVLAVFGRGLPVGLRTFLLTLAVVDDLLAIVVIAVFYTASINLVALAGAIAVVVVFGVAARSARVRWWVLLPLALVAWVLMHESGVHATIAGVLLGFAVAARPIGDEHHPRTHQFVEKLQPLSFGIALPVFAFFSAGVTLVDGDGVGAVLGQPVVPAIVVGLLAGKVIGVLGTTMLVTRLTPMRLPGAIAVRDLLPVGLLCGIGFTVSLLIAELSFPDSAEHLAGAKIGVLLASLLAGTLGAVALTWDSRRARAGDGDSDGGTGAHGPLVGEAGQDG